MRGLRIVVIIGCGLALGLAAQWALRPARISSEAPVGAGDVAHGEIPDPHTADMEPRVQQAISAARARVLDDPRSANAWGHFGSILDAHHLFEAADTAYARACQSAPDVFRWHYHRASMAVALELPPEAIAQRYARAAALRPDYPALGCRLGDALARWQQHDAAVEAYRSTLALEPDFAMARRGLGLALLAGGKIDAALSELEIAARLLPEDASTWNALAQVYRRQGRAEQADVAARRAGLLQPQQGVPDPLRQSIKQLSVSSAAAAERALQHVRHGRFDAAIPELQVALETEPENTEWLHGLGMAYGALGQFEAAAVALGKALAGDPCHVPALFEMGRQLRFRGQLDEAIRHFGRAVTCDPTAVDSHLELAGSLLAVGRAAEAVEAFSAAWKLGPLPSAALTEWGAALDIVGDGEGALQQYARALQRDPGYARAYFGIALTQQRLGRANAARTAYRQALACDPNVVDVQLYYGLLCDELGDWINAERAFQDVLVLSPGHGIAERVQQLQTARSAADSIIRRKASHRAEFDAIAQRLDESNQRFLGQADAELWEHRLRDPELPGRERVDAALALAREHTELGRVDAAVKMVEQAFGMMADAGMTPRTADRQLRGMVYLRQAEVQNCILRNNADCCVFPLAGGGVHADRGPALQARASYTAVLEARPDDLSARWLLNVVAQALGEHPQGLAAQWRIPVNRFAVDGTIGRFHNVAKALHVDRFDLCGGVITDDFDGDGVLDIMASSYDPHTPLALFRGLPDGGFLDHSESAGLSEQLGGLNIVPTDFDNDGFVDVLVLRGAWMFDDGRIRNSLLRNQGDGTFRDVTRDAGLALPAFPTQTAAWADFDLDGDLDVYIGNECRAEYRGAAGDFPSQLYVNQGDGTFVERAAAAGLTNDRYAKGVAAGDYDNDGDMDLYVSNSGTNRLYRNDGRAGFTDVAEQAGVTEPRGRSFATWFFDYDNDGWLDLFVAAFDATIADLAAEYLGQTPQGSPPRLYRNNRDGTFVDVTTTVGLARMMLPMGANFGDIDNDGWLDIYLTTGDPDFETLMPNVMLRNVDGRRFEDVSAAGGFGHLQKGHGVAFFDMDRDGDLDIYNQLGGFFPGDKFHNALYLNPGNANRWITVQLRGTQSNRAAYGARLTLTVETAAGSRSIHRASGAVSSFGGSPQQLHIGLGQAVRIAQLEVSWPRSGTRQVFNDLPLDSRIVVEEGRADYGLQESRPQ